MRASTVFLRLTVWAKLLAATCLLQGCVHEFPAANEHVDVRLRISHLLSWTEYDYDIGERSKSKTTRSGDDPWSARYILKVYPKGKTDVPVATLTLTRDDLALSDFTCDLSLGPGEWDIYVWQDFVSPDVVPPYYETEDFSSITYSTPYRGDTDMRDAFEGFASASVPETTEAGYVVDVEILMQRPLAKYVFVATDFEAFYNESVTRFNAPANAPGETPYWDMLSPAQKADALKGFSVVAKYPWYMPAVYDMFAQKVSTSWTGMYYDAQIRPLNGREAVVAMDYVFINHHESGAQVQLGLRTPSGDLIGLTSTITVPLLRGQVTYVRGNFLTSSTGSGLEIDFSFSGNFDIFIP